MMTEDEISRTAELLSKLDPGFLPYPIFEQIARLVALPIVEVIPLRMSEEGRPEVLLIERPADDKLFAGQLHTPGTVIRATDTKSTVGQWGPFRRIFRDELRDTAVGPLHYVGSQFHANKRGTEQAQLYWVEVLGTPQVGQLYDAENLPPRVMRSQVDFIHQAVEDFRRH